MQPVWRADRPQKGRYREFTQCDADIVGSSSLINETDLALIYHSVFVKLGIKYSLQINNRKILAALSELTVAPLIDITIAIDKLDKTGLDKVMLELSAKGLKEDQLSVIDKYLSIKGNNDEKLKALSVLFPADSSAHTGIAEVKYLLENLIDININLDFTLARGLNYYTGTIFEVKAPEEVKMGSIGGGGRYDDLTGLFGVKDIPGVGISFGVDRIYDVMEELNLFPAELQQATTALFLNMGEKEASFAYTIVKKMRDSQIACELFHEPVKMDKQFRYADKKKIRYAVIVGSKEMETGEAVVKNLATGKQETVLFENLANFMNHN
jgi:histidyl-tRNA synthetase